MLYMNLKKQTDMLLYTILLFVVPKILLGAILPFHAITSHRMRARIVVMIFNKRSLFENKTYRTKV